MKNERKEEKDVRQTNGDSSDIRPQNDGVLLSSPCGRGTEGEGAASCRHSEKPENQAGKLRRFSDYSESHNRETTAMRLRLGGRNDGMLLSSPCGRGTEGEGAASCCAADVVSPPQPSPIGEGVEFLPQPGLCRAKQLSIVLREEGRGSGLKVAFTLAEVLITLGIIGVVAALTLPTLNAAISKKVRAEQIRTVKYKFTKATTKMASLGLIGPYNSTSAFVAELQKHLKIIKVCTSSNLRACWPYDTIILEDGKEYDVTKITTGKAFKMTSSDTADYTSPTVGIVTGDGTPMIISYNTKCEALDPLKTYTWSTEDNKPVSNTTSNCVAAIFEVNGTRRPNKFREDVVAFNANGLGSSCAIKLTDGTCFGSPFIPTPVTKSECLEMVVNGSGIRECYFDNDYWAGAVKQCGGISNMPSLKDLYGLVSSLRNEDYSYTPGSASSLGFNDEPKILLWSGEEDSGSRAMVRYMSTNDGGSGYYTRTYSTVQAICLTD